MGDSIYIKDLAKKMITLSGANEQDIEIKITGLRNGEKLNEELFFKDEVVKKTYVKGILSTNTKLFPSQNINFNKLISEVSSHNKLNSIRYFEKLLPEYKKIENNKH